MYRIGLVLYFICLALFAPQVYAVTVKVAILENLLSQKLPSINYIHDYLAGIKVAQEFAKNQGVTVEYQYFPYGNEPLDILSKVNAVKQYNPDVIIGPRVTEQFIMLKFYFKDILVLSPLVNANEVFKLPQNFHTMSLPLQYSAHAMCVFINKITPEPKHIFLFTALDYASSVETSNAFYNEYERMHPKVQIDSYKFLADNVNDLDVSSLVKDYIPGDIIIMPNFSYLASIIMNKILTGINKNGLIFIGGDQWGPTDVKYIEDLRSKYKFTDYRLVQYSIDDPSETGKQFRAYYRQVFHTPPTSVISYLTFKTLLFALKFIDAGSKNQKAAILKNFIASKHNVKNDIYYVYKNGTNSQIESFVVTFKG